ncbi:MAG TPA: tripartite tricarboxylate transporter substrate binding protein [Burkholderiales bacterium]|nr:tripartite tricarboxylate transporter substrate binding protein [Burkholderiales bacterium]
MTGSTRPDNFFLAQQIISVVAALMMTGPGAAQNYPAGPLRIISPYPPGGGTDILARTIGQKLNERFGQPVVVDNRAGANGTVGAALVAKAPPDGHTLLIVPAGYAANPALYKSLPYDQARDLAPVSHLASGPLVLVVHPALPVRSVKDLIALAKSRPGEINVGSAGNGSLPHLCAELFNASGKVKLTHIPYKGSGTAVIDVMSGQVPVYFMNVLQSLPLIKSGKLRALAVTSPQRTAIAPELPAIAEAGLPGFDMTNWYGMLVPAATPRDVINKLQQEVARVLNLPELKERLAGEGMTVVGSTSEEFAAFLARETAKYNRIIQAAGIKGT